MLCTVVLPIRRRNKEKGKQTQINLQREEV